ncbi:hypothetical protein [Comamonas sp. A7-5]|uniref:hypothetical protein n=1 Tax=Comamonas sp. A7-5 TaxID=673549 RepID=UPI0031CF074B
MRKIIRHDGIKISNSALPIVSVSDHDRLLAAIPGHFFWMQAREMDVGPVESIRDRANYSAITPMGSDGTRWTIGASANGKPAIVCPDGVNVVSYTTDLQIRPDAFTVAQVFRLTPNYLNSINELVSSTSKANVNGGLAARININVAPRFRLLGEDVSPAYERVGTSILPNVDTLGIITFSTALGCSVRINGHTVAQNVADKRPLTDRTIRFGSQSTIVNSNASFHGQRMRTHMFNLDLSAPEYAGYLATLERELMSFYGIGS